jgi:hypothetical protein
VFITAKLWNFFAGELPSPDLNSALAAEFLRSGQQFKPLLRTLLLSRQFYDPARIRNQVKSPVQWLVGSVRMLECELPPPLVSANLLRILGQELFAPPNVKGWDGGVAWINTNTLLARYNEAAALTEGDLSVLAGAMGEGKPARQRRIQNRLQKMRAGGVNVERILTPEERADKMRLMHALEKRLLQSALKGKQQESLKEYLESKADLDESEIRGAIRLIMSTPEYQLT